MAFRALTNKLGVLAELARRWDVQPGQLWEIPSVTRPGMSHFLLCGHAARPRSVRRLMPAGPAPLVCTDPPYCAGGFQESAKASGTWGEIAADNISTRGFRALLSYALDAAHPQAAYVFADWRMWSDVKDLVEVFGLPARSLIVWDKMTPALGGLWRSQHELILFGSRNGAKREPGKAAYGNVLQHRRSGNRLHYTEKPVSLLLDVLRRDESSPRGACPVYDPFAGSSPLLEACEQLGRQAYLMELTRLFCAITLERASRMGLTPRLVSGPVARAA